MENPVKKYITAVGLDGDAPYSLGSKAYKYLRECNSGHKELTDEEIGFAAGIYDGYTWQVPVCRRCLATQENKNANYYSHATAFHLKEIVE